MLQGLVAGRERRILILSDHPAHKLVNASEALRVPDIFDFVSQPESAHQIEAKLHDFSLQEIPQVLQLGNTDLQRLRELLDEIGLLRTGFPVNEGHHDQPLRQLMPELRIEKRPSQVRRGDGI
jgi:hypothetical protein